MDARRSRANFIIGFLLTIITFTAFFPSLSNQFVNWDDYGYVVMNANVQGLTFATLPKLFVSFFNGNYHPLTMMVYGLEFRIFGLDPFFYHLTSLIIHCGSALLVMALLRALSGSFAAGALGALLFAVHPLRVESVAWISELKDVLCGAFYFASLLAYTKYVKRGLAPGMKALALFLFLCALLSKAMALTLPLSFLLVDYLLGRKPSLALLREKALFFLFSIVFGILGVLAQKTTNALPGAIASRFNLLVSGHALVFYIQKIIAPVKLAVLYPFVRFPDIPWYSLYGRDIIIVSLLVLAVAWSARYTRKAAFGSLFFLATLLPVLVFIPLGANYGADRYTYIPFLGVSYLAAILARRLYGKSRNAAGRAVLAAALCVITFTLSAITWQRCKVWKNTTTIWEDALNNTSFNAVAHYNLGNAYDSDGKCEKAVRQYDLALAIRPDFMEVLNNKCFCLTKLGRNSEALDPCIKAIRIEPGSFLPYLNLGDAYSALGDRQHALAAYEKALSIQPGDREIRKKRDDLNERK